MADLPTMAGSPYGGASWLEKRPFQLLSALRAGVLTSTTAGDIEQYRVLLDVAGDLDVPDGRLVACDPYIAELDEAPFTRRIPEGAHPLVGAWAVIGPEHTRVAALVLLTGSGLVVGWELAIRPDEDPSTLTEDEYFGFGVDSGTAFLGSPASQGTLTLLFDEDAGMLEDPISEALEAARPAVLIVQPEDGGPRAAISDSGWGDGQYPTWFGLHAAGEIVIVLVDFLLTDEGSAGTEGPATR